MRPQAWTLSLQPLFRPIMPFHPLELENGTANSEHVIVKDAAASTPPAQSAVESLLDIERRYEETHSFNEFSAHQLSFENPEYYHKLSSFLHQAWQSQFSPPQEPEADRPELMRMPSVSPRTYHDVADSAHLNAFISNAEAVELTGNHPSLPT